MAASLTASAPRLLSSVCVRRSSTQLVSTAPTRIPHRHRSAAFRPATPVMASTDEYTMADQKARFAKAKKENNQRVLDITSVYDPSFLTGARVLITGGNRGLGLDMVKECVSHGAEVVAACRKSSDELDALDGVQVITGIDVSSADACSKLSKEVSEPLDIVINNAGYFYEPVETIDSLNFDEVLPSLNLRSLTFQMTIYGSTRTLELALHGLTIQFDYLKNAFSKVYGCLFVCPRIAEGRECQSCCRVNCSIRGVLPSVCSERFLCLSTGNENDQHLRGGPTEGDLHPFQLWQAEGGQQSGDDHVAGRLCLVADGAESHGTRLWAPHEQGGGEHDGGTTVSRA